MDYGEKANNEARFNDPKDNLNLENWVPERDPRNLGGQAIFSAATETEDTSENSLGQIVDLAPGPVTPQPESPIAGQGTRDLQAIVGNRFNEAAITEVHRAEDELSQTHNISNFYDEIRNMAELAGEHWAA